MNKKKTIKITPNMVIGDVIMAYPEAVSVMQKLGMHCIGCFIAGSESIEEGAIVHNLDPKKVCEKINEAIKKSKKK